MNQNLLTNYGNSEQRMKKAIKALTLGRGILVTDDEDRENEGDMIFSAEHLTEQQMALLIREGSGIVCLCLTPERADELKLPLMVKDNKSQYGTAYTISIEAAKGVTTGVSAHDRLTTVKAASSENATFEDIHSPGHVFPLRAKPNGVLERTGHTEATVDMMRLAGLKPCGVLCEVTLPDGTMARMPEIIDFGLEHDMPVVTVQDIVEYRKKMQ